MLERSKDCHNEGIMSSLQGVIKRPLKGIIPMRGFWWFLIHVPGRWHMVRSSSGTLPGIICWSVPVTLPQILLPLLLVSEIRLMPSNNLFLSVKQIWLITWLFGYVLESDHKTDPSEKKSVLWADLTWLLYFLNLKNNNFRLRYPN